jgi:DNA (cytosine-5)-methyltransferase 1
VDNTEELPTVLSFCSGYAGIERGLDLAGIRHRVIAYVEIEAFAIANLVSKMESGQLDPAPIYTDLKTFPAELFRDAVDILTGGYPCQPFSAAGKRLGEKDPRHLWPYIREHIYTIQPARVFLENVEGHISMGLSTVISDLEEDGYGATWGIFSAREVGAPHQRKRVYILGYTEHDGLLATTERGNSGSQTTVLGYAKCERLEGFSDEGGENQKRREEKKRPVASTDSGVKSKELADTRCSASAEGQQQAELRPTGISESSTSTWQGSGSRADEKRQAWPAGAGSFQYEWEEPRTVWKTKPELGGTVDGLADRVDRIRLLGNGVVPQTAAKAWQVLSSRLEGL